MNSCLMLTLLAAIIVVTTTAFAPANTNSRTAFHVLKAVPVMPAAEQPVTVTATTTATATMTSSISPLSQGIDSYLSNPSSMELSLQERKKPTKEEIEAKKRNFNFWFWGGGFVAPFLATFYYFGFKFWEK
mmetsp:Transcript_13821/g.19918  ORF Transcript_13821/g.19918 Transcript_13821/m.19918 type:complete len:131 (+) Transcript_13821:115-507(+)|eukprot:CAMPEP_0202458302 /NCGR_PEP_ID=MMETSP1360-20130828/24450_1 /ASSEMBLY_ACC=CAM_ASM_000848 /TAXON_ID=515479 /ORGANISM="Licmophora paradoxa, Strain CCMP2313" /LENGTH=130 /DNA_ID=CAMNT_0049078793 /DNA_START=55 /DNA_END=447 /DNA_ORIENTATION=-